jgi:hypothetical protein
MTDYTQTLIERLDEVERLYSELLSEVHDKHEGCSRHERALWILRENRRVHDAYEDATNA